MHVGFETPKIVCESDQWCIVLQKEKRRLVKITERNFGSERTLVSAVDVSGCEAVTRHPAVGIFLCRCTMD